MSLRRSIAALVIAFLPLGRTLVAQDCQALLKSFLLPDPPYSSIYVVMTTLNSKNVASFTETRLYYVPSSKGAMGRASPPRFRVLAANSVGIDFPKFDFGSAVQVFSDRKTADNTPIGPHVGLPHHGHQKFDERQADDLDLELTDTQPVRATVTLRSWNNARESFVPVCEPGGFMYGSTQGVKYLLRVSKWPPNSP